MCSLRCWYVLLASRCWCCCCCRSIEILIAVGVGDGGAVVQIHAEGRDLDMGLLHPAGSLLKHDTGRLLQQIQNREDAFEKFDVSFYTVEVWYSNGHSRHALAIDRFFCYFCLSLSLLVLCCWCSVVVLWCFVGY
jgi:hypothetical protein